MDIFDSMNHHVGHTVDFGHGNHASFDHLGHYQYGLRPHADGLASDVTNGFGVHIGTLSHTPMGDNFTDHFGRLVTHSYEFAGQRRVEDGAGRHIFSIDPTTGTVTDSLGRLALRFR